MSTTRRIAVEVTGNVSGFTAAMSRINSSVSQVGQGLRGGSRDGSLFSKQLMAIGTTARYALAGQLVFGIRSAINNLADFKSELGSINALASTSTGPGGSLQGLGSELQDVGTSAILMSNKFGIAVGDVESYMQRFFSSFNPPGNAKQRVAEMSTYTNAVLNLATALGSEAGDPQKLAGGLTGLINALPNGSKNPGKGANTIANYFADLLRKTPALTGSDIASAAGRFASAKQLSAMSVPQLLSAFGVAAQFGGSPAVTIRGITQLFGQSLLRPHTPTNIAAYTAAGLPTDPNALAKLGGQAVLEKLINFVAPNGISLTAAQKKALNTGTPTAGLNAVNPALSGLNLTEAYNLFGRQESVRQFVNIIAAGGVPALRNFNKSLADANKENLASQMAQKRLQQSILTRAQVARSNLGLGIARSLQTPLEVVGLGEIGLSNFVNKHQTATQVIGGTAASLAAANALRKMGAFNKLGKGVGGKLGSFLSGITGVEKAVVGGAITSEELSPGGTVLSGAAGDGSRANPFWVIISPLSWALGGPSGGGGPSSPSSAIEKDIEKAVGGSAAFAAFKKFAPKVGTKLTWAALIAGAARGLTNSRSVENGKLGKHTSITDPKAWEAALNPYNDAQKTAADIKTGIGHMIFGNPRSISLDAVVNAKKNHLLDGITNGDQAKDVLVALSHLGGPSAKTITHLVEVQGEAKGTFKIEMVDTAGKIIKTVTEKGVPVKLWGDKVAPTTKGKPGQRRGT